MPITLDDRNSWRIAPADRFALIVDGADYFRALRHALIGAKELVVMIGWDFDFEIDMLPGQSDAQGNAPDGLPNQVGPFLEALVDRRPTLDIYLLKWSGGALIAPGRLLPALKTKLISPENIHLAFDGHHPIGACHHQKIVVIDDALAFCGGIDVTEGRWDTSDHAAGDPRRCLKSGEIGQPWHDMSAMLTGPAAVELGHLARQRWDRANDGPMCEPDPHADPEALWPPEITPDFQDVTVGISRTQPPERDAPAVAEIEHLHLDAIRGADQLIYIESQYFAADGIAEAIADRLREPNGPEVVVINPDAAQNAIEDAAMHVTRSELMQRLQRIDQHRRFRLLYPVNAVGQPIYVHAKLLIVDDVLLRVGSSNIDRRSMGFDTEADVAVLAESPKDRARITAILHERLAELLGTTPETVARHDSIIAAINALNDGRLWPVEPLDPGVLGSFLYRTRFFDPRYRRSAQARLGLTGRHLGLVFGAAAVAGALALTMRTRGQNRN